MTTRTRYFVIASLLILSVGVGTGLVAYYVGLPVGEPKGAFEEFRLMPRDATVIAYANVHEVMTSDLRQRIRQAMPLRENGHREFEDQTGINIETDIDRVVACFAAGSDGTSWSPLVLASGRFNEVKIETLMRDRGGNVEDYKSRRVVVGAGSGARRLALAFVQPGLVAVGDPRLVRAAIDLQSGGDSVANNPELMSLVGALDNANAWAVGRFDALRSSAKLPAAVAERLPPITWFSVSGRVNGGINGVVRAETLDEAAATDLRDVVRGFLALARLQAGPNPQFQEMMQSLDLTGTGKTVALSFSVPSGVFDALGAMGRRRAAPPNR